MTLPPKPTDAPAATVEKVPADAPGYQVGGPEPKTRAQLVAEQAAADEAKLQADKEEAAADDAASKASEPAKPFGEGL